MNTSSDAQAPSCANHPTFVNTHALDIIEHYYHARAKHPYFCDRTIPSDVWSKSSISDSLEVARLKLRRQIENEDVDWAAVLRCEVMEIMDAIANGKTTEAVEECYDAIAVLLRVVDVLEGRQPLGKPKEGAK